MVLNVSWSLTKHQFNINTVLQYLKMALPPTPLGYDNWNDYIETNAPALAIAQGLTLQQAKASIKLLDVSEPIRSALGQPYYRQYNVFTTWAARALLPAPGRPWKL